MTADYVLPPTPRPTPFPSAEFELAIDGSGGPDGTGLRGEVGGLVFDACFDSANLAGVRRRGVGGGSSGGLGGGVAGADDDGVPLW